MSAPNRHSAITNLTTDREAIEDEEGFKTVAGPEEHKLVTHYA